MNRRDLLRRGLALAGLGFLPGCGALPLSVKQLTRPHRIAYLSNPLPDANPSSDSLLTVFRQALTDLGYVDGQDMLIEERYASGDEQISAFTDELKGFQPEVIVVPAAIVALAVRNITSTIPIVSVGQGDLRERVLTESLARPTGNVTGLSTPVLAGKPLQLLKEAVPGLTRVLILYDATISVVRDPYDEAARSLGLDLQFVASLGPSDFDAAFQTAVREHADGLFVTTGPVFSSLSTQTQISELAIKHRLPSMWGASDAVARGGLLGYGANRADLFRRAATYLDRLLKGARPADLPIEQPTVFDLLVNVKTALALDLTIPQSVLAQATEVIQ